MESWESMLRVVVWEQQWLWAVSMLQGPSMWLATAIRLHLPAWGREAAESMSGIPVM